MNKVRKTSKSILSLVLAFAMTAAMLIAAPTKEVKAAYAAPTSTETAAHTEITKVEVTNVSGVTPVFQKDDNGVDATFIRMLLPSDTTISTLQNLQFKITVKAGKKISSSEIEFSNSGNVYTCNGKDLYNKSYSITVGNKKYILAAGITSAKGAVPSNEKGIITSAKLEDIATTMERDIIQSAYMGNPYFDEIGYEWTSVTYIVTGETLPNTTTRTAVKLSYTLNGAEGTESLDLTSGQKEVEIGGVKYQVTASFGDVIVVDSSNYKIDMTELLKYLNDTSTETIASKESVFQKTREIIIAQDAYFKDGSHTFLEGATVMDVMQAFLTFAYGESADNTIKYFSQGDSSRGEKCSYIDYIDGLSYRQVNQYAGWMYSDSTEDVFDAKGNFVKGSNLPGVMSNAYRMTKDTKITWFFTTNYMAYYE